MVRATLHPRTSATPELSILAAQAARQQALIAALARAKKSRQRLLHRLRGARARAFEQGYQQGLQAAQHELQRIAEDVRAEYSSLCEAAYSDVKTVAVQACEYLMCHEAPALLLPWLNRALALLKTASTITVRVKQRYVEATETHIQVEHAGVRIVAAPPSQAQDLVVSSDGGEISFAWQAAFEELLVMGGPTE